jgi:alkaline phosphatase D
MLRLSARPGRTVRVVSHDPLLIPDDVAGRGDPTVAGATLRLVTAGGLDVTYQLPADRWMPRASGWRLRRGAPVRGLTLSRGELRIDVRGLPLDLHDDPGVVDAVLTVGTRQYCVRFEAAQWFRPDHRWVGLDAPAPAACPVTVAAGPDRHVDACATVELAGEVTGLPHTLKWQVEGAPPLVFFPTGRGAARFVAPAVAEPTVLRLRLRAALDDGTTISDTVAVTVTPAAPPAGLPAGMTPDCAPFTHGVASGDPGPDRVTLWTRITPASGATPVAVGWEVASDPEFERVLAHGEQATDASRDFTIKVAPTGLPAGTRLWYRFRAPDGRWSTLGRTRTAPLGPVAHARFAVASCSSIYSGFFNAYRQIAARDDLDLLIHVGDYLYDFVDEQEQVRVPAGGAIEPTDLSSWRALHAYHLLDPDLRQAHAAHPWVMLWDNHDLDAGAPPDYAGSVQAFREWTPLADDDPEHPEIIYRSLRWGTLADVFVLDVLLHRNRDLVPGTPAFSIMGDAQFSWLGSALNASTATWRLLPNQRVAGTVRVNPDFTEIIDGERRDVFDPRSWDGFPDDRSRLFELLAATGVRDNLVLSGDSHISLAMDLVDDPANPTHPYDPLTSTSSVGVELLPTSISRGNFDEFVGIPAPNPIYDSLLRDTLPRNPHHRYLELTSHGYGVLDLTPDRTVAEMWYAPILTRSDVQTLGVSLTVQRGTGRWER